MVSSWFGRTMTSGDKKIAQLKFCMLLYALVARPGHSRHRRGVWWIDNTAALMSEAAPTLQTFHGWLRSYMWAFSA